VTVVEEAEPWSGARRHGAQEVHSLWVPRVVEPEDPVSVPVPYDVGTPAPARHSMQGAPGPLVAQQRVPRPCVARQRASEMVVLSCGHPWAHYSSQYQDRLLSGPLGLLDLSCTAPDGVERKDYGGVVLG
jgi:hypothetical protein